MTKAVEVITSVQRRRRWSRAEKERIVAAALEPGAIASEVARAAGICPCNGPALKLLKNSHRISGRSRTSAQRRNRSRGDFFEQCQRDCLDGYGLSRFSSATAPSYSRLPFGQVGATASINARLASALLPRSRCHWPA